MFWHKSAADVTNLSTNCKKHLIIVLRGNKYVDDYLIKS